MKELFTIASVVSQTYGHGDSGEEHMITKMGGYGTGNFPPVFYKKKDAERFLKQSNIYRGVIVSLELR